MLSKNLRLALATLMAATGCNHYDGNPVDIPNAEGAAHLDIASGNNQRAAINSDVPTPLAVQVTDTKGAPVANVKVTWSVVTGGGTITPSETSTGASGLASVNWTLGPTIGAQQVKASVSGLDFSAIFVATATSDPIPPPANSGGSVILRFDGNAWSTSLIDGNGLGLSYSSVWGASPTRVFAVGKCRGIPVISTFDGTRWTVPTEAQCSGTTDARYTSVWGSAANDVYTVQRAPSPPSLSTTVLRNNGQTWSTSYFRGCTMCGGLNAIWNSGPNDAVAVGDSGWVIRFDGSKWNTQTQVTFSNLNGVWSPGAGAKVFAVGDAGTILVYAGSASGWQTQTTGTTSTMHGVGGTSATDVFAVGDGGTILHYDGTEWSSQSSGVSSDLTAAWAAAPNSVFAVGTNGTVLHYDGVRWTAQNANASVDLAAVWGTSPTNVFAVGTARYP